MKDPIKAKIEELLPDLMELKYGAEMPVEDPRARELVRRKSITLAVVLRAIILDALPTLKKDEVLETVARWNLVADNYDEQSEECRQFIGNLLGV